VIAYDLDYAWSGGEYENPSFQKPISQANGKSLSRYITSNNELEVKAMIRIND
jgi:hypothetical protein